MSWRGHKCLPLFEWESKRHHLSSNGLEKPSFMWSILCCKALMHVFIKKLLSLFFFLLPVPVRSNKVWTFCWHHRCCLQGIGRQALFKWNSNLPFRLVFTLNWYWLFIRERCMVNYSVNVAVETLRIIGISLYWVIRFAPCTWISLMNCGGSENNGGVTQQVLIRATKTPKIASCSWCYSKPYLYCILNCEQFQILLMYMVLPQTLISCILHHAKFQILLINLMFLPTFYWLLISVPEMHTLNY